MINLLHLIQAISQNYSYMARGCHCSRRPRRRRLFFFSLSLSLSLSLSTCCTYVDET